MRNNLVISMFVIVLIAFALPTEGKRISLVPITANEVYRILREVGREDAVPEGRVVTQGIAAVSGFAVGLAKGIGGSLLVDLAANLLASNQNQTMQTQEICFNSRSLDVDIEADDDDDVRPQGRQTTVTTLSSPYSTTTGNGVVMSDGDGTNSETGTTTQTDGESINCVVVKQPPTVATG
ncbi:uncharacterized protein LOC101458091 [Ceratitis capitata]|uniref:(Mediterranean fruit fly) hypothetical protein n=1 Tax=Ceratitis capitata TaxID=7213 RepID=A0A811VIH8_CERCA|nr:uncharacterized protein LOC101458091 [Ceratitis capitata]CAD7014049.1 unnamed protein product [Ceratitis capitata]